MKALTMSTVMPRVRFFGKLNSNVRRAGLMLLGGALTVLSPFMAMAASAIAYPGTGTITSSTDVRTWTGVLVRDSRDPSISIPECRNNDCDAYQLKIALPADTWQTHTGGVRVTISWPRTLPGDNVVMYVYKNGVKVAQSTAPDVNSQSVLLPNPDKGLYNVYAAYKPVGPVNSLYLGYNGSASVEFNN